MSTPLNVAGSGCDIIHALTFAVICDFVTQAPESLALAEWIKADLLPVIEQVLDRQRAVGPRRRIDRIEIDLGPVAAEQAANELPRRLFEQLARALEQALMQQAADARSDHAAAGAGADLLAFLRHGRMPWSPTAAGEAAHHALLREVLATPAANAVLTEAVGEEQMLTRLLRQFDSSMLLAVAAALFERWPQGEREQVLRWSADTVQALRSAAAPVEPFWRWLLAQPEHPTGAHALMQRWRHAAGDAVATSEPTGADDEVAISLGLQRADFALLAPHWQRLLTDSPQRLRDAVRHHQQWLRHFSDEVLADIFGVLQADCGWLIERLTVLVPRAQLAALLRPEMAGWLAAPLDTLAPRAVLDRVVTALPAQAGRIVALFAGVAGAQGEDTADREEVIDELAIMLASVEGGPALTPAQAARASDLLCRVLGEPQACQRLLRRLDTVQLSTAARVLIAASSSSSSSFSASSSSSERERVQAWAKGQAQRLLDAGADVAGFWRSLLPLLNAHGGAATLEQLVRRLGAPPLAGGGASERADDEPQAGAGASGKVSHAVDSTRLRESLRVLGPVFTRAEIITVSTSLAAGAFAPLAPFWDRLLVLAPHWLRSEYPRLARTWLHSFEDEVLIDILAVVQAECSAMIEQLASALPREQLHAALRPFLARWFEVAPDLLAPSAIVDAVLGVASPGTLPATLTAGAPASAASAESAANAANAAGADATNMPHPADVGATAPWLHDLLARADMAQLQRRWPAILLSQRAAMRQAWAGLPDAERRHAIAGIIALNIGQQVEVALILQPALAPLMTTLQRFCAARADGAAVLDTAVRMMLDAPVARLVPAHLMDAVLTSHPLLVADVPPGLGRHAASAPRAQEMRGQEMRGQRDAVFDAAQQSERGWRDLVRSFHAADPRFGQLNAAQLHALVRTWSGLHVEPGQEQGQGAFLPAIEAAALRAPAPHAVFSRVLERLLLEQAIDLDEIASACDATRAVPPAAVDALRAPMAQSTTDSGAATVDVAIASEHELPAGHAVVGGGGAPDPLPASLRARLPQRLADAMLRADLSALDGYWSAIVRHHPAMLAQAAQRYLGRADAMHRLIASAGSGKLHDLLACLAPRSAELVAPLLNDAATFSALVPGAPLPAEFEQHVLRFAFARVMARPGAAAPADWLAGLLAAVSPPARLSASPGASNCASPSASLAHAWYESLRDGATLLKGALEQALFGGACLAVAQRRLQAASGQAAVSAEDAGASAADDSALAFMLTRELCDAHARLTDRLLADSPICRADPAVFSAAEWQMLARAQLPRQQGTAQQAFWRTYAAHLETGNGGGPGEQQIQAAFAAAFRVLEPPAATSDEGFEDGVAQGGFACTRATPGGPAAASFSADTIALLLMRAEAPDHVASASIVVLTQRLLTAAATPVEGGAHPSLQSALADPQAIARLTAILPPPMLARLLCVLLPNQAAALPPLLRDCAPAPSLDLAASPAMLEAPLWRAVFEAIFASAASAGAAPLADRLRAALTGPHAPVAPAVAMARLLQPLSAPQTPRGGTRMKAEAQALAPFAGDANLRNAGMVLIAPYIERLFALLDITSEGRFVDEQARQRGVHLLQYVITAEEATPEYLLSLNKLLCGVPAAEPVVPGIVMSDKEKTIIEQMLKGVIANWSALGESSVAGLRETFLQRDGTLYQQEDAWQLKIPQGTFDMLLDRLPWSYKMIKFSWMAAPLHVTWR